MKKKLFSIALAALSMIPVAAMAQSAPSQQCDTRQGTCQLSPEKAQRVQKGMQMRSKHDPFKNISNLTEAQRERLMQIKVTECPDFAIAADGCKDKAQCKAPAQCGKNQKDCKAGKDCKGSNAKCQKDGKGRKDGKGKGNYEAKAQRPDSAAMAARFAARKEARLNYLKEVQQVLTPEQYLQFLEDSFTSAPAQGHSKGMKPGKPGKRQDMKPGKPGKQNDKGDKKGRDGKQQKGQKDRKQQNGSK